jgi:hypothetical protein
VWPIEITQFLARNLKHHPGSELGFLEIKFGFLTMGKPNWDWFGWMRNLILPNFKKNCLILSSDRKVMAILPNHL